MLAKLLVEVVDYQFKGAAGRGGWNSIVLDEE
jgi:hypothetical protein